MDISALWMVSLSGMRAERQRMNVIMSNMANVHSTRTKDGGPYQRREVVFETMLEEELGGPGFNGTGVQVVEVAADNRKPIRVHRPGHPHADAEGYVNFPNINSAEEMVDLVSASRSYEANSAAFRLATDDDAKCPGDGARLIEFSFVTGG